MVKQILQRKNEHNLLLIHLSKIYKLIQKKKIILLFISN